MTNRGRRAKLDEIQRIAEAFREPVEAPDLSSAILARVDSQRCFLSRRGRTLVWVGRGTAALLIVLVVLGFTLASRYQPTAVQVVAQPMPVTDVISAVSSQASQQLTALKFSLEPNRGEAMEISSLIASVVPMSEISEPIGAALHAVRFVGPPAAASAAEPAWLAADWHVMPSHRVSRLPTVTVTAWSSDAEQADAVDRQWYEDESPLMSSAGVGGAMAPK